MAFNNNSNVFLHKHSSVRMVVGMTCFLSMMGAFILIMSYVCIRSLRSQGRFILLNLALMDFGIGLGNMVGAIVNFDAYYYDSATDRKIVPESDVEAGCEAQAFVSHYCTSSSVLWTMNLAIYMYILIDLNINRRRMSRYYLPLSCVLCYALPLLLTLWLLLTKRLGHAPIDAAAWCSIIINKNKQNDYIAATIGYDLWIYLTMVVCLAVYPALFMKLHILRVRSREVIDTVEYWKRAIEFLDFKLVLIPVAFILLRLWTCISNILYTYIQLNHVPNSVSLALIYLSGIGDSGQGLANGLLFVVFTKSVRKRMFKFCRVQPRTGSKSSSGSTSNSDTEKTYLLLQESNSYRAVTPNPSESLTN